jgi:hypothetical protein
MRLPSVRVRTLMLVVAVVAFLIWGGMMGVRSYDYYDRTIKYEKQERGWRASAAEGQFRADFSSECVEYFARLSRKYRRAMWHPWESVASDPHAPGYDQWVEQEGSKNAVASDPLAPRASTVPE